MRCPVRVPIRVGVSTRSSRSGKRRAAGRTPRRRYRRRRVHGPAGTLLWEDVLLGEIRRRPLQDLIFHFQLTVAPAQLSEFFLLRRGQPIRSAVVVGVGLGHPVAQARLADTKIFRQGGDRFVPGPGQLNRALAELDRVWGRHRRHPSWTPPATSPQVSGERGEAHWTSHGRDLLERVGGSLQRVCPRYVVRWNVVLPKYH